MSDYVKFSELRKPLQMSVIDAYSAMLFDFDNPIWYEQIPSYELLGAWLRIYGGAETTLKVKYKQEKDTTLGKRPVVMRVPEVSYNPSNKKFLYLSDIFQTARYEEAFFAQPLGVINHTTPLFYKTNRNAKENYTAKLEKVSQSFIKQFDSLLGQGIARDGWIFDMEKEVYLKEEVSGIGLAKQLAKVNLSILKGLAQLEQDIKNERIINVYNNYFLFSLIDPIHSHTNGATYMREFMKGINTLYRLFNQKNISEYLSIEENGTLGNCMFYVANGGLDELPYHKNMKHPTMAIPLRPYIVRADYDKNMTNDMKEMFESLWSIEETLIEGIELFVDSVSTMLNIYQDALRQEISRRLRPSYFSKWADEKGLTFQKISGEMRTPSKNP